MPLLTLANATDLDAWANTRESQDHLPQLIRRLILAGGGGIKRCEFRAAEGVHLAGWDGIVDAEYGNAHVPQGSSGWELGVGKYPKVKADSEYQSRTSNPLELAPSESTFVFVTPRRWSGKSDWVQQRQAEGSWRQVRAWDADDLHTWLETTPAVHVWISVLLGKHPQAAEDLNTFWEGWSEATDPAITANLLLAGREDVAERIRQWLEGSAAVLSIQTETRTEAMALLAASIQQLSPEEVENYLSRTVVVHTREAWNELVSAEPGLILIPAPGFAPGDAVTVAVGRGHFVMIPTDRSDGKIRNACEVPRLNREKAKEIFSEAGLKYDNAWRLAGLARRSLMSLRRKLARHNSLGVPDWAKPENARDLVSAMLAGGWSENKPDDLDLLSRLARQPYTEYRDTKLEVWAHQAEPPVRKVGDFWYVVSREDAWNLLSDHITKEDGDGFKKLVTEVFGEALPEFDLPDEDRYMSNVIGHESKHSGLLYRGLADSLALMGARGGDVAISSGTTARDYARYIVRQITESAGDNWKAWASITGVMSQLAEAAPDELLTALERAVAGDEPVMRELFRDKDASWHVSSPHTGLLWSLELMCWSEDYLGRAALVLARLAQLDPGGNMGNRPMNSLKEVFLPWHPGTAASHSQRLAAIDAIRKRLPEIAWPLCHALLPAGLNSSSMTSKPTWREWVPEDAYQVTNWDWYQSVESIVQRMLEDVGQDGQRWADLINSLGHLPDTHFDLIVSQLEGVDQSVWADADRTTIWHALREHISHHRSFPASDWSHESTKIDRLAAILDHYTPQDLFDRSGWLFSHSPQHPLGKEDSWQEHQKLIEEEQRKAVIEVLDQFGLAGIIALASKVERPGVIGGIAGEDGLLAGEEEAILVKHLASENDKLAEFARGLVFGLKQAKGESWIESMLSFLMPKLTAEQATHYLWCLPCESRIWELAYKLSPAASDYYWRNAGSHMFYRTDDVELAVHKLLEHGKPYVAVKVLSQVRQEEQRPPAKLVIEALEQMARTQPGPSDRLDSYYLEKLFEYLASLEDVDANRVGQLEFSFLPALHHHGVPHFLNKLLTDNSESFVDAVAMVFRGEGEEPRELSQENKEMARRAWDLLRKWRLDPNVKADPQWVTNWVHEARERLLAMNRKKIGDQQIGQALSGPTPGADDAWPHEFIRDAIEDVASNEIERGIQLGVYNGRGMVGRSLWEGGVQERELAQRYRQYAQMLRGQWPRTSTLLTRIADSYISHALREDQEAEMEEDLSR